MANREDKKVKQFENGHNHVQGFVFGINLEGSEAVVMEGIKAFTHAMTKGGAVLASPLASPALPVPSRQVTATAVIDPVQEPQGIIDFPEQESVVPYVDEPPTGGTERKRRIPRSPKLINDLDITAGPMPLKTFIEQKGPSKAQDRLVTVAAWLKKCKGLEEITRDHLYTCYQQLGGAGDWKCLNDFDSYVRTLANRKSWFDKGSNEGSFKITIVATNYVDAMTPAAAA